MRKRESCLREMNNTEILLFGLISLLILCFLWNVFGLNIIAVVFVYKNATH